MIWGWLAIVLFCVVALVIVWLAVDSRLAGRKERKETVRRRTAEERMQAQEVRNVRKLQRRNLGIDDDDKRGME